MLVAISTLNSVTISFSICSDTRRASTENNIYDAITPLEFSNAVTLESETSKKVCWNISSCLPLLQMCKVRTCVELRIKQI